MPLKLRPVTRQAVLETGAGMVLGLFAWIGYRQLSVISPFESHAMLLCSLIGGLLYRSRMRPALWAITGGMGVMILIVAYTPVVRAPAQALIREDVRQTVDAVVVLSSDLSDGGLLDLQGLDRLLTGIELVKEGAANALVVTAISSRSSKGLLYSYKDQYRMLRMGGGNARIFTTPLVANTHDEAIQTVRLARSNSWSRVAVVTSPMHTKRACGTIEKLGLKVVCVPAISRDFAAARINTPHDRLRVFQLWFYESLANSEYRRRGWI